MAIKITDKCVFCKEATDSVDHTLFWCPIIKSLWSDINKWLSEISLLNNNLTDLRKILGDLENGPIINSIILLREKVIYDSFKKERLPSIAHIKNEVKHIILFREIHSLLK